MDSLEHTILGRKHRVYLASLSSSLKTVWTTALHFQMINSVSKTQLNHLESLNTNDYWLFLFMHIHNLCGKRDTDLEVFLSVSDSGCHLFELRSRTCKLPKEHLEIEMRFQFYTIVYFCPGRVMYDFWIKAWLIRVTIKLTVVLTVFQYQKKATLTPADKWKKPQIFHCHYADLRDMSLYYFAQKHICHLQAIWIFIMQPFESEEQLSKFHISTFVEYCSAHMMDYPLLAVNNNTNFLHTFQCGINAAVGNLCCEDFNQRCNAKLYFILCL